MSWTKLFDDPNYRMTFSDWIAYEKEMEMNTITLSPKDADFLFDLMENPPPEPSEALMKAARDHIENTSKS